MSSKRKEIWTDAEGKCHLMTEAEIGVQAIGGRGLTATTEARERREAPLPVSEGAWLRQHLDCRLCLQKHEGVTFCVSSHPGWGYFITAALEATPPRPQLSAPPLCSEDKHGPRSVFQNPPSPVRSSGADFDRRFGHKEGIYCTESEITSNVPGAEVTTKDRHPGVPQAEVPDCHLAAEPAPSPERLPHSPQVPAAHPFLRFALEKLPII